MSDRHDLQDEANNDVRCELPVRARPATLEFLLDELHVFALASLNKRVQYLV